ncbi:hypothetical protein VQ643_06630 [Pseudomonas sp. F1_0610]|uniref:hypothetical protein n=1 Tax=Pseudomonas sp. F1_0610 TaxID=3114284 RepID=UPI0039C06B98
MANGIKFSALVHWLTAEQGGRQVIPPLSTTYYCTTEALEGKDSSNSWSIACLTEQRHNRTSLVSAWFLFENAPDPAYLKSFKLYEGARLVAVLEIID